MSVMDYDSLVNDIVEVLGESFHIDSIDAVTMTSLRASLFHTLSMRIEPMIVTIKNDAKSLMVVQAAPVKKARRPPTAYNLFTKYYQETHPSTTELFKDAGAAWHLLSDTDRAPFQKHADALAVEHGLAKSAQKTKRPPTAYNLFMRQYNIDNPETTNLFKVAAEAWNTLDNETKQTWKDKAALLRPKRVKKKGILNGYNVFMGNNMPIVANEHPSWDNRQKMKYVATLWNNCTDQEKQVWKSRADIRNAENAAVSDVSVASVASVASVTSVTPSVSS